MFLLCQNAALEQNKKVPVHSRGAERLSEMLGWKIQSQLEAAHRAGDSQTGVVMSFSAMS